MNETLSDVVLVVDDDPGTLFWVPRILEQAGLQTITAQDGSIALFKAEQERPALILLDIMMPELNGYEVCKRLKLNDETNRIPIIFMTALSYSNDKIHAFEVGAADYIIKPIQSDELLARVTTQLTLLRQQREIERLRALLAKASIAHISNES